jgi:hypothetical protein
MKNIIQCALLNNVDAYFCAYDIAPHMRPCSHILKQWFSHNKALFGAVTVRVGKKFESE